MLIKTKTVLGLGGITMANYVQDLRSKVGSQPIILVGSTIIVLNDKQEVLLQYRSDSFDWGLPGGAMELGESLEETAHRELFEETGLRAENLEFLKLFSGKEFYYKYPNGDETYNVIALYKAGSTTGKLKVNDLESVALQYFPQDRFPKLEKRASIILNKVKEIL